MLRRHRDRPYIKYSRFSCFHNIKQTCDYLNIRRVKLFQLINFRLNYFKKSRRDSNLDQFPVTIACTKVGGTVVALNSNETSKLSLYSISALLLCDFSIAIGPFKSILPARNTEFKLFEVLRND